MRCGAPKTLIGDEPFAILLPDDLVNYQTGCLTQMVETYNEFGGNVVAVKDVPLEDTVQVRYFGY